MPAGPGQGKGRTGPDPDESSDMARLTSASVHLFVLEERMGTDLWASSPNIIGDIWRQR